MLDAVHSAPQRSFFCRVLKHDFPECNCRSDFHSKLQIDKIYKGCGCFVLSLLHTMRLFVFYSHKFLHDPLKNGAVLQLHVVFVINTPVKPFKLHCYLQYDYLILLSLRLCGDTNDLTKRSEGQGEEAGREGL